MTITRLGTAFNRELDVDLGAGTDSLTLQTNALSLQAIAIDNTETVDIDVDLASTTSLTISNATSGVDLAAGVDLTASNGMLSVSSNVASINLSGRGWDDQSDRRPRGRRGDTGKSHGDRQPEPDGHERGRPDVGRCESRHGNAFICGRQRQRHRWRNTARKRTDCGRSHGIVWRHGRG